MKRVDEALNELGFKKRGKHYHHPSCPFFIDFVSPPVAVGNEPITTYAYRKTKLGEIQMLTPTDSVKDRLSAYYHWNDLQSLEQAQAILETAKEQVDLGEVKRWSKSEGFDEEFESVRRSLK